MFEELKQPGRFCWNELMTSDVAGAKKFYGELFGWEMEESTCGGADYVTLKVNGDEIGGITAATDEMPPIWGGYVTVSDVDASAAKAVAMGGSICVPTQDIPDGRFCMIKDPQGAMLSLFSHSG